MVATPQITASGRIHHKPLEPTQVLDKLRSHFPKTAAGGMDYVIPLGDCEADICCISNTILDFRIKAVNLSGTSNANPSRAVTAAEMLVRSTEALWSGLKNSLHEERWNKEPNLVRCVIEDTHSRTTLLTRDTRSPLSTPSARVAYAFSIIFLAVAASLIIWQISTPHSKEVREANILGISLALTVAAASAPIPVLMNWREWKREISWKYVRSAP